MNAYPGQLLKEQAESLLQLTPETLIGNFGKRSKNSAS